jgi:heat shock protein 90kDa beta
MKSRKKVKRQRKFWERFGKFIKLGCIEDTGNHKRLAPLLRFHSSKNEGDMISLDRYVGNLLHRCR